jgi:hypothetical protein
VLERRENVERKTFSWKTGLEKIEVNGNLCMQCGCFCAHESVFNSRPMSNIVPANFDSQQKNFNSLEKTDSIAHDKNKAPSNVSLSTSQSKDSMKTE